MKAPILVPPKLDEPYSLFCDASSSGVAGVEPEKWFKI